MVGISYFQVYLRADSLAESMFAGSERRFLVPPPSAFILGASWWTHLPDHYMSKHHEEYAGSRETQLFAPSCQVAMTHDRLISEPSIEWTTYAGKLASRKASALDFPIAGRVVGKHLYIPDNKEEKSKEDKNEKDKTSVEALVSVISPGLGSILDRTIGTFSSKPIRVISKPSKKAMGSKKNNSKASSQYS
jgi:recombining binding protein (suppressor of hairless)